MYLFFNLNRVCVCVCVCVCVTATDHQHGGGAPGPDQAQSGREDLRQDEERSGAPRQTACEHAQIFTLLSSKCLLINPLKSLDQVRKNKPHLCIFCEQNKV